MALVQEIARKKPGVILDLTRGQQVSNYPVFSFDAKVLQRREPQNVSAAVAKEVLLENTIAYVTEI